MFNKRGVPQTPVNITINAGQPGVPSAQGGEFKPREGTAAWYINKALRDNRDTLAQVAFQKQRAANDLQKAIEMRSRGAPQGFERESAAAITFDQLNRRHVALEGDIAKLETARALVLASAATLTKKVMALPEGSAERAELMAKIEKLA